MIKIWLNSIIDWLKRLWHEFIVSKEENKLKAIEKEASDAEKKSNNSYNELMDMYERYRESEVQRSPRKVHSDSNGTTRDPRQEESSNRTTEESDKGKDGTK